MIEEKICKFEGILEELKGAMEEFVESLRQEREAIIDFDLEKITSSYKVKHEHLLRVEAIESLRQQILKEMSAGLGYRGSQVVEAVLGYVSSPARVEKIRTNLSCIRSMAQAAQELNETQRRYIVHSLDTVQTSLMLLDSLQGKGRYQCYDRQGGVQLGEQHQSRMVLDSNF